MTEDRYVRIKELKTIIGLSRSTIMNWANEREVNKY